MSPKLLGRNLAILQYAQTLAFFVLMMLSGISGNRDFFDEDLLSNSVVTWLYNAQAIFVIACYASQHSDPVSYGPDYRAYIASYFWCSIIAAAAAGATVPILLVVGIFFPPLLLFGVFMGLQAWLYLSLPAILINVLIAIILNGLSKVSKTTHREHLV